MKGFSHNHWIKEISKYTGDTNVRNTIIFALSYTLQSLRAKEDFDRFKWDEE